ncbi:MAG: YceI family protein [Baekduiaceae bacterium]
MPQFGPDSGSIVVRTSREGRAAKVGHDLVIDVTGWSADVDLDGGAVTLDVDPGSLRVREGVGGLKPLSAGDKAKIEQTITAKVLRRDPISFRSTSVDLGPPLVVSGELTLGGRTRPLQARVELVGDTATATVRVRQSVWGMKPYSTMMGALRVGDEVEGGLTVRFVR